jgi:hypothetical protein
MKVKSTKKFRSWISYVTLRCSTLLPDCVTAIETIETV